MKQATNPFALLLLGLLPSAAALSLAMPQEPEAETDAAAEAGAEDPRTARPTIVLTERALRIHHEALLIDGHNDLPWAMRSKAGSDFGRKDIRLPQPDMHTDIPRLIEGGMGAQFWSVFVPASTAEAGDALHKTVEQIDVVHRMCERYPDVFQLALSTRDILNARRRGRIASLIGIEGGYSMEDSLGCLRMLYSLGVRYMTLTHSDTIEWADAATDEPRHGGLSEFGEEVVRTMNELGMLVDISHVSPETMDDALRVSRAPIIFSHSSAWTVAPHPRNVPDEILKRLPENGGVVMINFFSGFIEPTSTKNQAEMFDVRRKLRERFPNDDDAYRNALRTWQADHPILPGSVHDVVDHIDHVVRTAGIDHVGLGADYDGVGVLPRQLEDVSGYPYITQELLDRGYTPGQVHKILGGNVLRAFGTAEQVAEAMQAETLAERRAAEKERDGR